MIKAEPGFTWDINLKELRAKFPDPVLTGDEQTELMSIFRKNFEFEIPKDHKKYSRMNIHLECAAGTDEGIDLSLGGEFSEESMKRKNYPVAMAVTAGGKTASCTIGVEPGLVSFYPKIARLHDSVQDRVSFKVRVKYMH